MERRDSRPLNAEKKSRSRVWSYDLKHVTRSSELKVNGNMAAFTRYRAFFQFLRPQMSVMDSGSISQDVLHSLQYNRAQCARHAFSGETRKYSSDVKSGDDLVVKYLDGDDSGRSDTIIDFRLQA